MSSKSKSKSPKSPRGASHKKQQDKKEIMDDKEGQHQFIEGMSVEWNHHGSVCAGKVVAILTEPQGNIKATDKQPCFWVEGTMSGDSKQSMSAHLPGYELHLPGELAQMHAERSQAAEALQAKKQSKKRAAKPAAAAAAGKKDDEEIKTQEKESTTTTAAAPKITKAAAAK